MTIARSPTAPSLTERVVLALLAEAPSHGFALARELRPDGDLGRILTVRRPLVYRALDRLVETGSARATVTEQSDVGPTRTVHRSTAAGTRSTNRWLAEPVEHVRDLRVEFLVKLRLRERRTLDLESLIHAQRAALGDRLAALTASEAAGAGDTAAPIDVVDRWRYHSARAAVAFLEDLSSPDHRTEQPASAPAADD